jgi:hypothetical protein
MSLRKGFITYIDISNSIPPPPANYILYMNITYTPSSSTHIQATNQTPITQDIFGNNDSSNAVTLPANGNITINIVTAYVTSNTIIGNPYPSSCMYFDPITNTFVSGSQSCQDTTTYTDTYVLVMKEYDISFSLLATHTIPTSPYTFTPNANTKYIVFTWQYQNTTSNTNTNCGNCKPPLKLYMGIAYNPANEIAVSSWGAVSVFGNDTSSNPKYLLYNGNSVTVEVLNNTGGYNTLFIQETDGLTTLVTHNVPLPSSPYTFSLHPNTTDIVFGFII